MRSARRAIHWAPWSWPMYRQALATGSVCRIAKSAVISSNPIAISTVCPATLVRAEQRLTQLAHVPPMICSPSTLRQADVVHADETGWRINSVNAWLWVFSNQDTTIYAIRSGLGARGHGVPEEILGPDFDGRLIVDGLATYTVLDYKKGQCNAHLIRRAKKEHEKASSREKTHLDLLIALIQDAIALAERRTKVSNANYQRQAWAMEERLVDWLSRLPSNPSDDLSRLADHVQKHLTEWFAFLFDPNVPPTNNQAERMIRLGCHHTQSRRPQQESPGLSGTQCVVEHHDHLQATRPKVPRPRTQTLARPRTTSHSHSAKARTDNFVIRITPLVPRIDIRDYSSNTEREAIL